MDFLKAVAGVAVLFIIVVGVVECQSALNKKDLNRIIESGDYCVPSQIFQCSHATYAVLPPGTPTIYERVNSEEFKTYIPIDACRGKTWLTTSIDDESWQYCELRRDPNSYSIREKIDDIGSISLD